MRVDRIQPQDLVNLRAKDRVLYGRVARGRRSHRALPTALPRRRVAPRYSPTSRRTVGATSDDEQAAGRQANPNQHHHPPNSNVCRSQAVTNDPLMEGGS